MPTLRPLLLAMLLLATAAAPAAAGPVASNDATYTAFGRVFPDPQGGVCAPPCSPNAQGMVGAVTHLGFDEFEQGVTFLNSKPEFQRYLEVWPLDSGKFPGNNLGGIEFTPHPSFRSAGTPTSTLGRDRHPLYMLRVTDETVPDAGKKRYVLSLSIHGIERAGAEGGTRAMEDLVTAALKGRLDEKVIKTQGLGVPVPTFGDVLKKTVIYFTYPNPDGWARGSLAEAGPTFQRYNGNGIDLNRDFPDIGFSFRGYSSLSEPESRALYSVLKEMQKSGIKFDAGDDLHGQITADSFSYTLLPHGKHDYAKNARLLDAAKTINKVQADVLGWSPLIQPNDAPPPDCISAVLADVCTKMYGQTFGTVYDTINYTVTGAFGDFFDSTIGLEGDGIDNEMSFSHLVPDVIFDKQIEQLHVDGNAALIYAHVAELLGGKQAQYKARGTHAYVPNTRIKRARKDQRRRTAPAGTKPQADIDELVPVTSTSAATYEFQLEDDADTFNGGMRVDVTVPNVQGVSPETLDSKLTVQCRGCDEHPGVKSAGEEEWVDVTDDFNQSPLYLQAGLTASVNYPQANVRGNKVTWRVVLSNPLPPAMNVHIEFSSGPATFDGETKGGLPPFLAAYNVASTDFWKQLNRYTPAKRSRFKALSARKLARSRKAKVSRKLDTVVLTDEALPGYREDKGKVLGSSKYTAAQYKRYAGKLKAWVRGGGNLVLTDGALQLLPSLFPKIKAGDVKRKLGYLGQIAFTKVATTTKASTFGDSTLKDPLARNIDQPGARFNGGLRRQMYEPTPLGFAIQDETGGDFAASPAWDVARKAFEAAGGRLAAVGVEGGANGSAVEPDRVALGELKLGKGVVRIAGALLPQPSTKFDHQEGLEPYAVTYSGYYIAENLTDWCRPGKKRC